MQYFLRQCRGTNENTCPWYGFFFTFPILGEQGKFGLKIDHLGDSTVNVMVNMLVTPLSISLFGNLSIQATPYLL